jgi:hypothetical protein
MIFAPPRANMQVFFQHRRQGVVGDCRQMNDVDSYHDAHKDAEPIHIVFDFATDLAELAAADEAAQSSLRRQRFVPPRGKLLSAVSGGQPSGPACLSLGSTSGFLRDGTRSSASPFIDNRLGEIGSGSLRRLVLAPFAIPDVKGSLAFWKETTKSTTPPS